MLKRLEQWLLYLIVPRRALIGWHVGCAVLDPERFCQIDAWLATARWSD